MANGLRTTSTTINDDDLNLLNEKNITIANAIRGFCQRLREEDNREMINENIRLKRNIEGLQNEIARLYAALDHKK